MDVHDILMEAVRQTPNSSHDTYAQVPKRLAIEIGGFAKTIGNPQDDQIPALAEANGLDPKDIRTVKNFLRRNFYVLCDELRYCQMKDFFTTGDQGANPDFIMFSKAAAFTLEYTEEPQTEVTDDRLEPQADARE